MKLKPNTVYYFSVCILDPRDTKRPASVFVHTQDGRYIISRTVDESEDTFRYPPPSNWKKLMFTFEVKPGQENIKITLSDKHIYQGTIFYWDFVELEDAYKIEK